MPMITRPMTANPSNSRKPNRLAAESSPYLQQHAHNPVDWYPWGPEAFDKARRENKPIFLSVGYSTCYWCHVMERESFENDDVAAVMNSHFVNIKVDREERPGVDQLYMTAVQVQTHQGGWPMSVFLTPTLEYFYGGTYFPPRDAHGRPGFTTLLNAINEAWTERPADVMQSARQFTDILKQLAVPSRPKESYTIDNAQILEWINDSISDFDERHGGFGGAPKFPRETLLQLLLSVEESSIVDEPTRKQIRRMLRTTLDAMMHGGIRDQLGGGFHRYSTDAHWLVPHFEIMLYDNAMLGEIYARAARQLEDERYAIVARELFDFILREMTSSDGAFYSAFDAEVDAQEGMPYLWTIQELRVPLVRLLIPPHQGIPSEFNEKHIDFFLTVFGVDRGPNFSDPHHGTGVPEKNVLFVADPEKYWKDRLSTWKFAFLKEMQNEVLSDRDDRKQPQLDKKVITSWNALMIRALSLGANILKEPRYTRAAITAAEYLLLWNRSNEGFIARTHQNGFAVGPPGTLEDYALFAYALLSLHTATGENKYLEAGREIACELRRRFEDPAGGFFFSAANADDLIVRQQTATDSPLPAGAAVAARVLHELGDSAAARRVIQAFGGALAQHAVACSAMVEAAMAIVTASGPIHIDAGNVTASSLIQQAGELVTIRAIQVSPTQVNVSLEIADGWHINANPASSGLIATEVFAPPEVFAEIVYPPGDEFLHDGDTQRIYQNSVVIKLRLHDPQDIFGSELAIRYQPCNDRSCLAPATKRFTIAHA